MSGEGLHIDTGASIAAEHEHNSEEANQVSIATTAIDPESLSEGTDESPIFDDSDKTIHDLSPTTPHISTPEHHGNVFEKINESPSSFEPIEPEPAEPEPGAEKPSQEPSLSEETHIEAEHLNEELEHETSILAPAEPENSGEEPAQDQSTAEPSKEDEKQDQSLSVPAETEEHIEDAPQHHATSITAEPGSSEEENVEEKPQETPESSIAGAEGASKDIVPEPSHSDKTEPDTALDEEMQEPPEPGEKKLEESANKELPETPLPAEIVVQESPVPNELKDLTTNQSTEALKEAPKPTPSDREKRALDVVKRSRYQFRVAIDIFLQLVNENEDDEGVIRLNLVERDSDLRKVVGMLGLKLQGLNDAERELDWAQLLDRYEAKKEQE
jgi:hypothetical protein